MSQDNILKFLNANKGNRYTAIELARHLGIGQGSCNLSLYKMRLRGEVLSEPNIKCPRQFLYYL